MYTVKGFSCGFRAALCCTVLGFSDIAGASSILARYDFDNDAGGFENGPDFAVPGLNPTGWYAATGTVSDFAGTEGRALAARNYLNGNALRFDIAISSGFSVDIDDYAFSHLASGSGPANWTLEIDGFEIASGATPPSFGNVSGPAGLTDISGILEIALHGFGAASNSGTYRVDDFELFGTVRAVPVGPSIAFLGSAMTLLRLMRRS